MHGTRSPRRRWRSEGSRGVHPGDTAPRRRFWRARRWAYVLLAVLVLFSLATARLFIWPPQGVPGQASAIVMLQGNGDRLQAAVQLAKDHRAPVLVVSRGRDGYGGPCVAAMPGIKIICFDPNPANTRGEAEFVGRLAQQYHWRSVILVTVRAQDRRARLLTARCFSGSVYVSTVPLPLSQWPYEIAYEWGALVKALVTNQSC
jgi:uncharacterized SAM-binding protein YcdF (DUF218 family)